MFHSVNNQRERQYINPDKTVTAVWRDSNYCRKNYCVPANNLRRILDYKILFLFIVISDNHSSYFIKTRDRLHRQVSYNWTEKQ